jgi:2-polyprenyl-3-methyl-5-hydroxy-6-metoxy-1,4-benzoquinol methylase
MAEIKYSFDKCKICGGPIDTLRRKTVDGLVLTKCKFCGLEFVKLIPFSRMWAQNDLAETTEYYSSLYAQVPPKFGYGLNKIVSNLNSTGIDAGTKKICLLDVGCGNGDFLLMCKDKGFDVFGIEQSVSAAHICKKRGLDTVYTKDIGDLENDRFDIITLFDVAEHIENPKLFFKMIYCKLNPGGIVYLETPRRCMLDIYIYILELFSKIRSNRLSRDHVQLFSDKSLHILLEDNGFDIVLFEAKQSLSWTNKKQYILNLGVRSELIAGVLEKIANIAITLKFLGRNKAVLLAKKSAKILEFG